VAHVYDDAVAIEPFDWHFVYSARLFFLGYRVVVPGGVHVRADVCAERDVFVRPSEAAGEVLFFAFEAHGDVLRRVLVALVFDFELLVLGAGRGLDFYREVDYSFSFSHGG